jgi:hypothetical protein
LPTSAAAAGPVAAAKKLPIDGVPSADTVTPSVTWPGGGAPVTALAEASSLSVCAAAARAAAARAAVAAKNWPVAPRRSRTPPHRPPRGLAALPRLPHSLRRPRCLRAPPPRAPSRPPKR